MPGRRPPRNGFCITPAPSIKWARCTRARRSRTGWRRSASAASRSLPRRSPAPGFRRSAPSRRSSIASTSLPPPDTSISPPRWSVRSGCWTARWRSSAPWAASSPSRRRSGARPTNTGCRGWRSSTRWTGWGPIFTRAWRRCGRNSRRTRTRCSCRSAPRIVLADWSIWCR